ncbi:oligosaccharide flippase family protein [Uliginosibacterium paludis]|uniref:Oligosaccharide flippase family protein n=1 Tax=Uliginosibacterium paludis TaxID=1615952 RepID=A0ABV2CNP3_9RHOO
MSGLSGFPTTADGMPMPADSTPPVRSGRERADLVFVYAAYALRYVYLLVLTPFYGRVLGVDGYAQVLAAMSLMNMVWLFVSWGFVPAGGREIATASRSTYGDIFWRHFSARTLLAGLALVAGIVASFASPVLARQPLIGVCAVLLGIVSAYNLGWYFTASQRPRATVKLEVLGFILSLVPILLLVRHKDDAIIVLACLLVSAFLSLLLAHWWVKREILPLRFVRERGLKLVSETSTLFIYNCSSAILVASSTFLLSLLASSSEVGHFGAAERLVSVGLSVMGPAGQIFIPRITALFARDERAAYGEIRKALVVLFGTGVAGLCFSLALGPWIVPLIFGQGFAGSVPILRMLACVFPLAALTLIIGNYILVPLHQEKILTRITIGGAVLNLLIAIPASLAWGAMGMAVARVVGEAVVASLLIHALWRMGILGRLVADFSRRKS